jgi:membrane protein implicated in regulation of membrane protease activity
MDILFWIALVVVGIGGYSWYRGYQDRVLTKRLKSMRDKDAIIGEIDAATAQVKNEGDFWRRNSSKF